MVVVVVVFFKQIKCNFSNYRFGCGDESRLYVS